MTDLPLTEAQLRLLWGKTCRHKDDPEHYAVRYHPLLFHLLDVAHAALALWDNVLPTAFKERIASALRCDLKQARWVVSFLAGVHDLGKATPGFQLQSTTLDDWLPKNLAQLGLTVPLRCDSKPHNFVSTKELCSFLRDSSFFWQSDKCSARVLGHITGAHHGTFPESFDYARWGESVCGDAKWHEVRLALMHELRAALCPPRFVFPAVEWREDKVGAVPQLAGFISVADWIGSSFKLVGHRDGTLPLAEYILESENRAQEALYDFGWAATPAPRGVRPDFAEFWGFAPNALQEAVIEQTRAVTAPFFLLIEAPMGVGKTETALWACDAAQAKANSGFYVALPTQATSNAMYKRVKKFLIKRYKDEQAIHLQLVHSHARLSDKVKIVFRGLEPLYDSNLTPDEARVVAASWFCGAKRPLLAPFGVGTIDQTLLAALQTRHWFVRLFGLAGKVVVFDEVHAYDTYMSRLLTTLIAWLREVGCSVILLSATLPTSKRRELTRAWGGELPADEAAYPRLTWCSLDQSTATSIPVASSDQEQKDNQEPKPVAVRHLRPDEVGKTLRDKLRDGGCAAIICNTVVEAQEMFERLRSEVGDVVPAEGWTLFHARMPFGWRQRIEDTVVKRFGKQKAKRPPCAVVVATQVIEQSLDLDFDWMASFMAPGDLLLQRLGRLQRHSKDENGVTIERPALLQTPEIAVMCDATGNEIPSFGRSEKVYELYVLLRSWLVWRGRSEVQLPDEIEALVQAVYDDKPQMPDANWQNALTKAEQAAEQKRRKAEMTAEKVVVSVRGENGELRDPYKFVDAPNLDLYDEDDPTAHKTLRAATRDGDPSVMVVCLCRHEGQLFFFNDAGERDTTHSPLDLDIEPTPDLTRKLIEHSLSLSHRALFEELCRKKVPVGWKKSPVLRHFRPLKLDNNLTTVNGYRLRLHHELGLVIEKE
ncbi:MAG: CRISPR-associated helicase Cas3' [Pyrinomonadaceae bacterium MAG19_C2-C3]|nr:CRISPR-associated helicase Cas3' [Pyrinomonadaceae bacterium MAG19_C2-C3]